MNKTLYTMNINDFAPAVCAITYPLLRLYARKCGAAFHVITDRRFPEWPITYEKLQIHRMAAERDDDWSIFLDADTLVHPETPDWTNHLPMDTVAHNGVDMAAVRWRYNDYLRRDGRHIGSCNWNATASRWCRDLWRPLDMTPAEAVDAIFPTADETNTIITPDHLVDDYALSCNIARFGLKVQTLLELQKKIGFVDPNFYWHAYTVTIAEKVAQMRDVITRWKLERYVGR